MKKFENPRQEFRQYYYPGTELVVKSCRVYHVAITTDPGEKALFKRDFPLIQYKTWKNMDLVGAGKMHYTLLMDVSPGGVTLRNMSYKDQVKLIEEGVPVLDGDKMVIIRYTKMTVRQVCQVFDGAHVRTRKEQEDYIASLKVPSEKKGGEVVGKKFYVFRKSVWTEAQLEIVIERIKKNAPVKGLDF